MDNKRRRNRAFKVIWITVNVFALFVLAEVAARMINPTALYTERYREKDTDTEGEGRLRVFKGVRLWDELRYSTSELEKLRPGDGELLIAGLGDSIMYGSDLEENQTYFYHLEKLLPGRCGRPVKAVNFAVPGYNIFQERAVFEERVESVRPDIVIVHMWEDDSTEYSVIGNRVYNIDPELNEKGVLHSLPLPGPVNNFLITRSRFYQTISVGVAGGSGKSPDAGRNRRAVEALADMRERVSGYGGKLILILSPPLDVPAVSPAMESGIDLYKEVAGYAMKNGIPVLDLGEALEGTPPGEIALDDCHFNEKGHMMTARILADVIAPLCGGGAEDGSTLTE